jgi:hypothetical protein
MNGCWRLAQGFSVLTALGVVALLVVREDLGLFLTWDVLVPLVPASLLIAPQVWRNLCPIAVVHQLPVRLGIGGARRLPVRVQRAAPAVAAALFYLIVPLRLTVFNESGPALAAFVLAVLVAAFVGAVVVTGKGGWCATFCPVLPVERLYGQQPVLDAPHAHCVACTGCIRSCYDLKPERSLGELVRGRRTRPGVLRRPTGLFAAAFPGFVLGYFTAGDVGVAGAYVWILGLAAASALAIGVAQRMTGASDRTAVRVPAAVAAGLYYWFAVPAIAEAAHAVLGVGVPSAWALRAVQGACVALPALWLADAPRRERLRGAVRIRRPHP